MRNMLCLKANGLEAAMKYYQDEANAERIVVFTTRFNSGRLLRRKSGTLDPPKPSLDAFPLNSQAWSLNPDP